MTDEVRMPIELYYGRAGEAVRFRTRGMSNHELRALIFGLWLILGDDDRSGMVDELDEYARNENSPYYYAPPVSVAIADGYRRGGRMS